MDKLSKFFLLMLFSVFVIFFSVKGVDAAMMSYCGDGTCQTLEDYNESDPLTIYYCPLDCGVIVSSRWCEDSYALIAARDCPSCLSGGSYRPCSVSAISPSELGGWCSSNDFSASGGSGLQGSALKKYVFWLIFLIIGFIIGYFMKKKKKKRR